MNTLKGFIDLHNVVGYYGEINVSIIDEVLTVYPNTQGFIFNDKQYTINEKDKIVEDVMGYYLK